MAPIEVKGGGRQWLAFRSSFKPSITAQCARKFTMQVCHRDPQQVGARWPQLGELCTESGNLETCPRCFHLYFPSPSCIILARFLGMEPTSNCQMSRMISIQICRRVPHQVDPRRPELSSACSFFSTLETSKQP